MARKKGNFQKEIERDEARLEEIYNKILGVYKKDKSLKVENGEFLLG